MRVAEEGGGPGALSLLSYPTDVCFRMLSDAPLCLLSVFWIQYHNHVSTCAHTQVMSLSLEDLSPLIHSGSRSEGRRSGSGSKGISGSDPGFPANLSGSAIKVVHSLGSKGSASDEMLSDVEAVFAGAPLDQWQEVESYLVPGKKWIQRWGHRQELLSKLRQYLHANFNFPQANSDNHTCLQAVPSYYRHHVADAVLQRGALPALVPPQPRPVGA